MTILKSSKWRQRFRVHPAADIFPMMSGEELQEQGKDILANGLREKIDVRLIYLPEDDGTFRVGGNHVFEVLDGRNRLEAMERVGIDIEPSRHFNEIDPVNPVARIISANMRRRHLTPSQIADVIVGLAKIEVEKETGPRGPVYDYAELDDIPPGLEHRQSRLGGRGKKNPLKEKALEIRESFPEEVRPSDSTIKRSMAKAEGKKPKPKLDRYTAKPLPKPKSGKPVVGRRAACRIYLDLCTEPDVDIDAEIEFVTNALREIAGKRELKSNGHGLSEVTTEVLLPVVIHTPGIHRDADGGGADA